MNREALKTRLKIDEGVKLKPYFDCCGKFFRECECEKQGKLSIGVGRCIEDIGISEVESDFLLDNDCARVVGECRTNFQWFTGLCDSRQLVLACMAFNVGMARLLGFKRMLAACAATLWDVAASEMLASAWSAQVKGRAVELAQLMRDGDTVH